MWPFKASKKRVKVVAETLEERMELIEATMRSLKTEWLDTYDKLYRLAGRMDASRRWAGEKPGGAPTTEPEKGAPAPSEDPAAALVDPNPGNTHPRTRRDLLSVLTR